MRNLSPNIVNSWVNYVELFIHKTSGSSSLQRPKKVWSCQKHCKLLCPSIISTQVNSLNWSDLLSRLEGGKEGAEILSAWLTHKWGYRLWHNQCWKGHLNVVIRLFRFLFETNTYEARLIFIALAHSHSWGLGATGCDNVGKGIQKNCNTAVWGIWSLWTFGSPSP